ncbi:MAG: NUDIX domain-containing protein [Thermoplasmata archaeon]|nr:NUDIX domain-containing protein [Thermoplasmata archaeon]
MYEFKSKNWLEKDGKVIIGEGRATLLKYILEFGSLTKAAEEMGMSYRHAWGIVQEINEVLGKEIIHSERGGVDGGKTQLTDEGKRLLEDFNKMNGTVQTLSSLGMRTPLVAADGLIVIDDKLVLIRRKFYPFEGKLALPGGMVEYDERVEDAVCREMKEETGLDVEIIKLLGVYSEPGRDPRGHVVSAAYILKRVGGELRSGDDAKAIELVDIDEIPDLAFDHNEIIEDFLKYREQG